MNDKRSTPHVWDMQNEERKTEIIGYAVEMARLCKEIAAELGPGWSFGGLCDEYGTSADLRYQFEDVLHIRRNGDFQDKCRVRISGCYPTFYNRTVIHRTDNGGELPSRSCAVSRGARAIARDIRSYLLTDILALREKGQELVEAYKCDREEKLKIASELAATFDDSVPDLRKEIFASPKISLGRYPNIHGSVTVMGDDHGCNLEVSQLSYDAALRIANVLQEEIVRERREKGGEDV